MGGNLVNEETAKIIGENARLAVNKVAWEKLALYALKLDPFWDLIPKPKPLTPKEQKAYERREKKRIKSQKAHDKAVKNGAYCDSDY